MTRSTPLVREGILSINETKQTHTVVVGSEQWFAWLHRETSTSFIFQARDGSYSARKERVGHGRGGWYWKAYRRHRGKLYRAYLGRAEELTLARLNEIALTLTARMQGQVAGARNRATGRSDSWHLQRKEEGVPPLLASKLHPPRLLDQLIERPQLLARLDSYREHKLTVVQAPAGSGKTTLVNQWLATRRVPYAWLSLDTGDNDVLHFWRSLMMTCQQLLAGEQKTEAQAALALLSSAHAPFHQAPLQLALTRLLNALSEVASSKLLVLDDYHAISEPSIHETLAFFIDRLPASVHMLLLSRAEPPLPLLRWRAAGLLCELHTSEIRFSLEESAAFLKQVLPVTLSRAVLLRLNGYLEGWPAGLRLLGLTLSRWHSTQAIEQALLTLDERADSSIVRRSLFDYFMSEILEKQPEPLQRFLLQSSVLSRLCAPLCDSVLETQESARQLATIQRTGLFLEALEGSGEWYRYHALFSEAMRSEASRRLGEEALATLSLRASCWYEQHDMLVEAIEAARLARDMERMARLIERINEQNYAEACALRRWLEQLPETVLRAHPMLCHLLAVELRFPMEMRFAQADSTPGERTSLSNKERARIEELLRMAEEGWRDQGMLHFLAANHGFRLLSNLLDQEPFLALVEHARRAFDFIPLEETLDRRLQMYRSTCLLYLGMDQLRLARVSKAQRLLEQARKDNSNPGNRHLTINIGATLGCCHLLRGELRQASTELYQALADARELRDDEWIAAILLELAWLAFERNDLAGAQQQAREALEIAHALRPSLPELCARAELQLALVQHAQGESKAALRQLTELWTGSQREWTPHAFWLRARIRTWQGRLLIATGELHVLQDSLPAASPDKENANGSDLYTDEAQPIAGRPIDEILNEEILRGRLWLAQGRTGAALRQFTRLVPIAQQYQHHFATLELQLLLALAYAAGRQQQQAHYWLRQTLAQAAHEGYVRLFLNEGRQLLLLLRSLLPTIQHEGALRVYALSILRAAAQEAGASRVAQPGQPGIEGRPVEPLSTQEQRMLQLLAAGWSNQEIAHELLISVNTVKYHLKHLYQKLGVNNRLQASALARGLSLDESL